VLVYAWHVHTDFDVRRTSRTFSGKAQYLISKRLHGEAGDAADQVADEIASLQECYQQLIMITSVLEVLPSTVPKYF